ncbi:Calcium-dependent protein kinase 13 [Rhizophlyctis rosea]|uniref:Calcineurin subunit B n=1 Tax=Rhizophlyctis rosea TaxID=64517 RepID=A0AAD5S1C3_9FUNG|nr:Calcium-dependent protein kinase 13 [Rhizophlyctis rosea]
MFDQPQPPAPDPHSIPSLVTQAIHLLSQIPTSHLTPDLTTAISLLQSHLSSHPVPTSSEEDLLPLPSSQTGKPLTSRDSVARQTLRSALSKTRRRTARTHKSTSAPEIDPNSEASRTYNVPLSRVLFSAHDVDDSGGISLHEFRGLVYSMGYYLSDQELQVAVATLDTDGNGEISYQEFLNWYTHDNRFASLQLSPAQASAVQSASEYFQYFDRDSKGHIKPSEFTHMFNDMQSRGYFRPEMTVEGALREIKGGREGEDVSFNDYVSWLVRVGSIVVGK